MLGFMKTEFFKQMNVGFVLDEGLANPDDVYSVFYGERGPLCKSLDYIAVTSEKKNNFILNHISNT